MSPRGGKHPMAAVLLCLIPGAAHLYLGRTGKGIGLLCLFAALCGVWFFSPLLLAKLVACVLYLSVTVVPALEVYQIVRYGKNTIDTDSRPYLIFLLLTNGFAAVPLLWRSERFSRRSKYAWTAAVSALAVVYLTFLARYWRELEDLILKLMP